MLPSVRVALRHRYFSTAAIGHGDRLASAIRACAKFFSILESCRFLSEKQVKNQLANRVKNKIRIFKFGLVSILHFAGMAVGCAAPKHEDGEKHLLHRGFPDGLRRQARGGKRGRCPPSVGASIFLRSVKLCLRRCSSIFFSLFS